MGKESTDFGRIIGHVVQHDRNWHASLYISARLRGIAVSYHLHNNTRSLHGSTGQPCITNFWLLYYLVNIDAIIIKYFYSIY